MMKKWGIYFILLCIAWGSGTLLGKYCYRFPTEEEMRAYHEQYNTGSLEKLESKVYQKTDGQECIVFKGRHMADGSEEDYFVEAGKRWVIPFMSYNWKSE